MSCDATTVFDYVEGDNLPALVFQYLDADGDPIDITGFSIDLHIGYDTPKTVNGDLYDPTNGYFRFIFSDTDLDEVGKWNIEVQITNVAGQKLTIQDMGIKIKEQIA